MIPLMSGLIGGITGQVLGALIVYSYIWRKHGKG